MTSKPTGKSELSSRDKALPRCSPIGRTFAEVSMAIGLKRPATAQNGADPSEPYAKTNTHAVAIACEKS